EAKRAITDTNNQLADLPKLLQKKLPHSKAALRQTFYAKLKALAHEEWQASPRYTHAKHILPMAPTSNYLSLMRTLSRKHTSNLTQLRTSHAPLTKHLHRIGKAASPLCPTCLHRVTKVQFRTDS
ncbi:hypothetical protein BYT27DRAFT_7103531, partial [Phlegmacium glaucopus]